MAEKYKLTDINKEGKLETIRKGFQGFVLQAKNQYGAKKAIKFSSNNNDPIEETIFATKLEGSDLFVIPDCVEKKYKLNGEEFNCFVQPWINGETLGRVVRYQTKNITPEFIKIILC